MYPVIRSIIVLATTPEQRGRAPEAPSEMRLTCWPWDADVFLEMNNGRHLTLMDLGRFKYGMEVGLLRVLRKRKWGLVVGGATVQFRKRIYPFQRFTLSTRLLGRDEKWFYFHQTTLRGETAHSSALVRTAVISGRTGTVPTQDVAEAMGAPDWTGALPEWARAWAAADKIRPWPPALTAAEDALGAEDAPGAKDAPPKTDAPPGSL